MQTQNRVAEAFKQTTRDNKVTQIRASFLKDR